MIRLPLFEMLQACVDHFLDPMEFRAPCIFRVVESSIHMSPEVAEPGIQIPNAGIQIAEPRVVDEDSHKYSDRGNANGKGDLNCLIGHRFIQNTPFRPALPLFEMLQPRVNYFFDPVEFGAPRIFSVIEPLIDGIESSIDMSPQIAKPRVVDEDSHKYSDRGNANGKGDLNSLIGHRCTQNTSFYNP